MTEKKKEITIRMARAEDAPELLALYAPYVTKTAITFEYEVPTVEEFEERIAHTLEMYPYLVAESEDEILGYAYAGEFKARPAYDWAVETTIYVREDCKKQGVGKKLYDALEKILAKQNILNVNACIAYPTEEDEYLTKNSIEFHEHLGYRLVGRFTQCGYKFHRWYDMVWMEKLIGEHVEDQPRVKSIIDILKV